MIEDGRGCGGWKVVFCDVELCNRGEIFRDKEVRRLEGFEVEEDEELGGA